MLMAIRITPQHMFQHLVIEVCHGPYSKKADYGKNGQDGQNFFPDDELSHSQGHDDGHGTCQHTR